MEVKFCFLGVRVPRGSRQIPGKFHGSSWETGNIKIEKLWERSGRNMGEAWDGVEKHPETLRKPPETILKVMRRSGITRTIRNRHRDHQSFIYPINRDKSLMSFSVPYKSGSVASVLGSLLHYSPLGVSGLENVCRQAVDCWVGRLETPT